LTLPVLARVLQEFTDRRHRQILANQHQIRRVANLRDGGDGIDVKRHALRQERLDGQRARRTHEHRVAVGGRRDGRVRRDVARCAGAVLDHDRLLQHRFQLGRQQASDDVVGAARRKADDQAHRLVRVIRGVRQRRARNQRNGNGNGLGDAPLQNVFFIHDFPLVIF
jgi:hypothetical protein